MQNLLIAAVLFLSLGGFSRTVHADLKLATFDVDASPPVGSNLAYDPAI